MKKNKLYILFAIGILLFVSVKSLDKITININKSISLI